MESEMWAFWKWVFKDLIKYLKEFICIEKKIKDIKLVENKYSI